MSVVPSSPATLNKKKGPVTKVLKTSFGGGGGGGGEALGGGGDGGKAVHPFYASASSPGMRRTQSSGNMQERELTSSASPSPHPSPPPSAHSEKTPTVTEW